VRILFASPEAYPFVSTGGLADVSSALPGALSRAGHDVKLVIPMYRDVSIPGSWEWLKERFTTSAGETFGVGSAVMPESGFSVLLVSKDEFFGRKGLYGPTDDSPFSDNVSRFAFFSRAVTALCETLNPSPDVLHLNDWQTGLSAAYMRNLRRPAVVFTIHNLRYQGNFPVDEYHATCLPESLLTAEGLEFYGDFSFMKAGIVYSDAVTTVSETYSLEIRTPQFGEGMDGILRHESDKLTGILNGIDRRKWNPSDDSAISVPFDFSSVSPRRKCRRDLIRRCGLKDCSGRMIAGMVTRLTSQKGIDLLLPVVERMVDAGISIVILGTGERSLSRQLRKASKYHAGFVSVNFSYDEEMARKIFAGSDLFLMPSRFEPCGLGQMIAMRYGSVPLVRSTGGLADSVVDVENGGCGYIFRKSHPRDLLKAVLRARSDFGNRRRWAWLVKKCMRQDNSWSSRIPEYLRVYGEAVESRRTQ